MPEPNPILGVHVVPGGVAWAQVRREEDGSFRVLAWGRKPTPGETVASLAAAAEILGRRGFRRRGAFVALPDVSGCLVTAVIPPDELHLEGEDLHRELYESTPFDPEVASLRSRPVGGEGRRREFLVAAIAAAQERQEVGALGRRADATVGLGFATACTLRGARALGLVPAEGFLVEVSARVTAVVAVDGRRARRSLVAAGRDDAAAAARPTSLAAAVAPLAADVLSAAAYHRAQRFAPRHPPEDLPPPIVVGVGVALADRALREALAEVLGPAFGQTAPRFEPECRVAWDHPPGDDLPALAGAVGAALEAFAPAGDRLDLRPPPAEVPEAAARPAGLVVAGVLAGLALVAAGTGLWWTPDDGPGAADRRAETGAVRTRAHERTMLRAAWVASWRDALASVAEVLDDGDRGSRAVRRAVVEAYDGGWRVDVEAKVRGGEAVVAEAREDLASGVARRVPRARSVLLEAVRRSPDLGNVESQWEVPAGPADADASDADACALALADLARRRLESGAASEIDVSAPQALAYAALHWGDEPPRRTEFLARADGQVRILGSGNSAPPADPRVPPDAEPDGGPARRPGRDVVGSLLRGIPSVRFASDEHADPGLSVRVTVAGPGTVRVESPAAWCRRTLERRGPGDGAPWAEVAARDGGSFDLVDEVPGPSGRYEWRVRTADGRAHPPAAAHVEVPVGIAFVGRGAAGAGRFELSRSFAGEVRRVLVEVRPDEPVRAALPSDGNLPPLAFGTGMTLTTLREVVSSETTRERLPEYLPDGRVRRDAAGAVVTEERAVERPVRVLEALLRAPDGALVPFREK